MSTSQAQAMKTTSQLNEMVGSTTNDIQRWRAAKFLPTSGKQGKAQMLNMSECLGCAMAVEYKKVGFSFEVQGSLIKHLSAMTEEQLLAKFNAGKTILIPYPCTAGVAWISRELLIEANPEFDGWENDSNMDVKAKYDKLKAMMEQEAAGPI